MKRRIKPEQLEKFMDDFERESRRWTLATLLFSVGGVVVAIVIIAWLMGLL